VTVLPASTVEAKAVVGTDAASGAAAEGHVLVAAPGQLGNGALPEVAVVFSGSRTRYAPQSSPARAAW